MTLLYYRKSDKIISMKLAALFLKTEKHQKLFQLLWVQGMTTSVREFSLMSELPYATTYDLFVKLEKMGFVRQVKKGRANLYSGVASSHEVEALKKYLGYSLEQPTTFADYDEMNLPLVGSFEDLNKEKAQSKEELLVKVVFFAKSKSSLLRTLPLLVRRLGVNLDFNQLSYWSKKYHVERELGFVLDLTGHLAHEKKYSSLAKQFKDNRWSKFTTFLESESNLKGFQKVLVEENTPELAKKWYLKMNMGMDSFESHFSKFTNEA